MCVPSEQGMFAMRANGKGNVDSPNAARI